MLLDLFFVRFGGDGSISLGHILGEPTKKNPAGIMWGGGHIPGELLLSISQGNVWTYWALHSDIQEQNAQWQA